MSQQRLTHHEYAAIRAKELRHKPGLAEKLVWTLLRDQRMGGLTFQRQVPIGSYVAEFYCHEVRLVVELEGEIHGDRTKEDSERTRYLESQSLRVIRVANADVFDDLRSVIMGILRATGIDVQAWLGERGRMSCERAKELGRDLTPAEKLVWSRLKDRRLNGLKFRRKCPIGPYIVDFHCREAKLIVELDGETHDDRMKEDSERTRYLESHGMRVIRVQNADVFADLESVAFGILRAAGIDVEMWLSELESRTSDRKAPSP